MARSPLSSHTHKVDELKNSSSRSQTDPKNSDEIRSFIAIELPEPAKEFLGELSHRLRSFGGDVKWVRADGMHVTLRFLGGVNRDLISILERELAPVFSDYSPCGLSLSGVGCFPNLRNPRVIWVGVDDPTDTLVSLASEIEDRLALLGFKRENRAFHAHITLGRVRSSRRSSDLSEGIRQLSDASGPSFIASRATLFRSILQPSGAEHTPLHYFHFRS